MAKTPTVDTNNAVSTMSLTKTKYKYPIYVYLKTPHPYKSNTIICNGIKVSTTTKTKLTSSSQLKKLEQIEKYLIIETSE